MKKNVWSRNKILKAFQNVQYVGSHFEKLSSLLDNMAERERRRDEIKIIIIIKSCYWMSNKPSPPQQRFRFILA
jgi:hypothetical protein